VSVKDRIESLRKYLKRNREYIGEVIFGYKTKEGKQFDICLLIAIVISVIGVILSSNEQIKNSYGILLTLIEWIFTILFSIEYALRIYTAKNKRKYIFSFMGIVDLLSIVPTYLFFFYPPIHVLVDIRVIRLIRIFRIYGLTRYMRGANTMQIALRSSRPKITVFLLFLSITVTVIGTLMYVIEGQSNGFEDIPKSIYWTIVTITTVGYGDVVPLTATGRFLAALLMILGYAIIALPTGIVSAEITKEVEQQKNNEKNREIIDKLNELQKTVEKLKKDNNIN
tara:strand:- start:1947 stop:2792 length:846 start_codon:yes stop_codon:yes gene_type:complete